MTSKQYDRLKSIKSNEENIYMPAPDRLSDIYIIYKYVFNVVATDDICDEDYMTAIAQRKSIIPKGTELEVEPFTNLYGNFLTTIYKGSNYYIDYSKVELKEIKKLTIRAEKYWNGKVEENVYEENIEM